ncbi:cytochrome P450 [Haematococcus lacustris]
MTLSASSLPSSYSVARVACIIAAGALGWSVARRAYRVLHVKLHAKGKPLPIPAGGHWLLGSIPLLAKRMAAYPEQHVDSAIMSLMKEQPQLGKIWVLKLVVLDFVVVLDPDAVREVLMVHNFPKSPTYDGLHPFVGRKSLVVSEAGVWAKQRKAFNPGFQYQFLKDLVPVFTAKTQLLCDRFDQVADTGQVLLLHTEAARLTMDVICDVALSTDFGFLTSPEPPPIFNLFMTLLKASSDLARRPDIALTRNLPWVWAHWRGVQYRFDSLLLSVIKRRLASKQAAPAPAPSPSPPSSPLPSRAPAIPATTPAPPPNAAPSDNSLGQSPGQVGKAGLAAARPRQDILGLALQTAVEEGAGGLDLEEVLSQVKTFLFAGHDTTASTVAWAVYEVSRNPAIQAKVLEEVDSVLQGRVPGAQDLAALRYLGCVVKEALRMWPPGGTARIAPPGTTLQGFDVGGKVLYLPHHPLHREPDLWGPDVEEFRPERWQDETYVARLHPCAYTPFSKGPRDCIGQTFANMESKALLAMLYQRFTFEYAGEYGPEEQAYQITSFPRFRVPVRVRRRSTAA